MISKKAINQWVNENFNIKLYRLPGDFCGWQGYSKRKFFQKVLVAFEVDTKVVEFAIANKIDLIVVHHPFCYPKNKAKYLTHWQKPLHDRLLEAQIAILVLHTNYDASPIGMNAGLLKKWGYPKSSICADRISYEANLAKPMLAKEFLKHNWETKVVQYANLDHKVSRIRVCAGAGGVFAAKIQDPNVLYITGEVKWSDWRSIAESKQPVIVLTHYMENFFTNHVSELIEAQFKLGLEKSLFTLDVINPICYYY